MIIRSSKALKDYSNLIKSNECAVVKEEVKPVVKETNRKNSKKKTAPVVEETPVVVEEEKIDLGEWLKDNIEE